ncbi:MAG: hypothetical protein ACLPSW_12365 [Roseiarcus sp.]
MGELGRRDAPRWEWRTFGAGLSDIEAKVGLTAQMALRQSDEIYLLNFATPHSAKIRGGVLEVKRLLQVDSNGLEQWSPVFKACFPLSVPMVQSAFAALDLRPLTTRREVCDLEEFLDLVANDKALRAIQVKKARRQFVFGDCAAEFVRLHIGPVAQESFCVEDEDPSKVVAAVRELGLDPHANISFPKGIERALTLPIQAG